ncbi:MAG: hypothetical protein KJ645_01500, partial [Planctomycetes bacterium]|nr:hypothetical protein [Planctomycetota bacterium]
AFHGTNLLIHFLVVLILYLLACRLTRNRSGSFLGALIFAVHPAHVEAVTWIVGRAELLSCLFCLLATLLHFGARKQPFLRIFEAACFALAVLSKENALAFTLTLWILEVFLGEKNEKRKIVAFVRGYGLYLFLILGGCLLRYRVLGRFSPALETAPFQHADLFERMEAALSCLADYFRLSIYPYPLKIFYHISEIRDLTLARIAILLGFIALTWIAWKKEKPLLGWLLWIPVSLLPVLNLVPIGAVFAERFFYLPSAGSSMAMGFLLTSLIRRERVQRGTHLSVWFPTILICCLAALTLARNPVFDTSYDLWKDAVRKGERFAFPHYNLGECYFEKELFEYQSPEMQGAVRELRESLSLNPDHPYAFAAHYRLGQYHLLRYRSGNPPDREHLRAALDSLELSLRMSPPLPEMQWKPAWLLAHIPLEPDGTELMNPRQALEYLALVEQAGMVPDKIEPTRIELLRLLNEKDQQAY